MLSDIHHKKLLQRKKGTFSLPLQEVRPFIVVPKDQRSFNRILLDNDTHSEHDPFPATQTSTRAFVQEPASPPIAEASFYSAAKEITFDSISLSNITPFRVAKRAAESIVMSSPKVPRMASPYQSPHHDSVPFPEQEDYITEDDDRQHHRRRHHDDDDEIQEEPMPDYRTTIEDVGSSSSVEYETMSVGKDTTPILETMSPAAAEGSVSNDNSTGALRSDEKRVVDDNTQTDPFKDDALREAFHYDDNDMDVYDEAPQDDDNVQEQVLLSTMEGMELDDRPVEDMAFTERANSEEDVQERTDDDGEDVTFQEKDNGTEALKERMNNRDDMTFKERTNQEARFKERTNEEARFKERTNEEARFRERTHDEEEDEDMELKERMNEIQIAAGQGSNLLKKAIRLSHLHITAVDKIAQETMRHSKTSTIMNTTAKQLVEAYYDAIKRDLTYSLDTYQRYQELTYSSKRVHGRYKKYNTQLLSIISEQGAIERQKKQEQQELEETEKQIQEWTRFDDLFGQIRQLR